jgi:hypothetical protein
MWAPIRGGRLGSRYSRTQQLTQGGTTEVVYSPFEPLPVQVSQPTASTNLEWR